MSDPATSSPSFDDHCRSLGRLCVAWAVLNRKLTDLASVLIGQGPEITACLFPGTENMKPRLESIRKMVVLQRPGDDEWQARLLALVKLIQEPLSRSRNRYIHDEWHEGDRGLTRIEFGAVVDKSDPSRGPFIRAAQWHRDTTDQVEQLIRDIEQATEQLTLAVIILSDYRHEDRPLTPFWQAP